MRRLLLIFAGVLLAIGSGLVIVAARFDPVVRTNCYIGILPIGGLTRDEASKKLRGWWENEKQTEIALTNKHLSSQIDAKTLSDWGLSLDVESTLAQIPLSDFWESASVAIGIEHPEKRTFEPKFRVDDEKIEQLAKWVTANQRSTKQARAQFVNDKIILTPEQPRVMLDIPALQTALVESLTNGYVGELPLTAAEKKVPDEELQKITDVVATFVTRFPTYKVTRCSNIKLASSRLNGIVIMPGETFSFNAAIGKRTVSNGFKMAGVFKNGRHDQGIGGGICQVSTTLYNAALMGDLEILKRQNHSMPVPYVPIGRDATLDFGNIDLAFKNNKQSPIALATKYEPGRLTIMVLGKKTPGLVVKITSGKARSWDTGIDYVIDKTLRPGTQKVVEKGSDGHSVITYRMVYQNGVLIRKETLGRSYYKGGPKIIARNVSTRVKAETQAGKNEEVAG